MSADTSNEESAPTPRISVSRDALRADLAEMELRLRVYFDEQLRHKADIVDVQRVVAYMEGLDQGNFTASFRRAVLELVDKNADDRNAEYWSGNERFIAVASIVVMCASLLLSIALAINGGLF